MSRNWSGGGNDISSPASVGLLEYNGFKPKQETKTSILLFRQSGQPSLPESITRLRVFLPKTFSLSCSFLNIFKMISHHSHPRRRRHKCKTPSRDYVTGLGSPLSLLDGGKSNYEIFPSRYGASFTPIGGKVKEKMLPDLRSPDFTVAYEEMVY